MFVFLTSSITIVFLAFRAHIRSDGKRDGRPWICLVTHPLIVSGFDKTKPPWSFPSDEKTFHLRRGHRIIITNQMSKWSPTARGPVVSCVGGYLSNGVPINFPVDRYTCVERVRLVKKVPGVVWREGDGFIPDGFVPHERKTVSSLFGEIT